MSAPRTDIEKQKRRHAGPLVGMALAVVFALGLFAFWYLYETDAPDNASEGVDATSGDGISVEDADSGNVTIPGPTTGPVVEPVPPVAPLAPDGTRTAP